MKAYLKRDIKELIREFPRVGDILNEYGIGCVPCSVGTCQLLDVIDIHNLSPGEEDEMMAKIGGIIHPGGNWTLFRRKGDRGKSPGGPGYSPPIKRLVNEHVFIKRWAELIPEVAKDFDFNSSEDRELLYEGVNFIRSYADRYHHAKEEEILFTYFDEELDIIKVMYDDHERARGHVRALYEALEKTDKEGVAANLLAYGEILREHIKKEDEILFPWMDRNLTTRQVGELFEKFQEVERSFGGPPKELEEFVKKIEERLNKEEETK